MYSFPNLEPVCCSMSSSNCCFLTCIEISQETGQVVWYSHLFKSFPQFVVIHTIKDFGVVNKVEVDVFLELSRFFYDPTDAGNLISGTLYSASVKYLISVLWTEFHLRVEDISVVRRLNREGQCLGPGGSSIPVGIHLETPFPFNFRPSGPLRQSLSLLAWPAKACWLSVSPPFCSW